MAVSNNYNELNFDKVFFNYLKLNKAKFQRYNSWNHCYRSFGDKSLNNDTLALHLGFYLASWGMYRGSSNLLERDYKVHIQAVEIINNYRQLRCDKYNEISSDKLNDILNLVSELSIYYKKRHNVTPTDTLISKIILGSLGCLPAFDRFFIDGVNNQKFSFKTLKRKSLLNLFDFYEDNKQELEAIKLHHPQYPIMKIIDMYFWQIGYDITNTKNKNGKT